MHSEKMAKVGLLVTGIAEEIVNPLSFIMDNLNSLDTYFEHISKLLEQKNTAIYSPQHPGLLKTPAVRKITKFKKQINFNFIKTDINSLLDDSMEGLGRVQKLVEDLTEFSSSERREIVEEDINDLLDRALNLASNELRFKAEIVKQYGTVPKMLCDSSQLM
jgi:signal transduction histidine kinase